MDSSIHHFGMNQPYISQLEWFVHPHEKAPAFPSEIRTEDGAFQVEEEGGAESIVGWCIPWYRKITG